MSAVAEAAVSSVNETRVSFLLDGRVHEVDLALWRGPATPKMGDIIEVALNDTREVVRFFPRDAQPAPEAAATHQPAAGQERKLALKRPAYSEKELEIFGRPYVIRMRHGFVLSADSTTEQKISTSYRASGTGWVPDIQSHEYTTSDIRLLQQGEKIEEVSLSQKYKVRSGDEVTIVSIARKGAKQGWWLGIQNHTTNRWWSHVSTYEAGGKPQRDLAFFPHYNRMNHSWGILMPIAGAGVLGFLAYGASVPAFFGGAGIGFLAGMGWLLAVAVATGSSVKNELQPSFNKILEDFS